MLRISNHFSYGASVPMLLKFIWSLPGAGEWKIAKIVAIHWSRWPPCPYMVKTFKNLLLQNRGCLQAESLHKSSGTGGLPKLLKWWSYIVVWPFYCEVKFASICICMGPIHLYGKTVDNFKWLLWAETCSVATGSKPFKILLIGILRWPQWFHSIEQDGR